MLFWSCACLEEKEDNITIVGCLDAIISCNKLKEKVLI